MNLSPSEAKGSGPEAPLLICTKTKIRDVVLKLCVCNPSKKGLTLVFLHGMPGQISNWKKQLKYFCDKCRCIVYDQRGYGASDKPSKVSIDDYLQDLEEVLKHYNLKPEEVVLIGHSFGSVVAQTYARNVEVKGLVLIGSLPKWVVTLSDKLIEKLPSLFWRKLLFTKNPLTVSLYKKMFFSPTTPEEVFHEFMEDNEEYISNLPVHVHRYFKYFKHYNASSWLKEIRTPTLIVVGEHDRVTPPEWSKQIHQQIPGSEIKIIKGAGHLVLYEKPQELNEIIDEYLNKISRP